MSMGLTAAEVRALTARLGMRADRGALPANGRADGRTEYHREYKRRQRLNQKAGKQEGNLRHANDH